MTFAVTTCGVQDPFTSTLPQQDGVTAVTQGDLRLFFIIPALQPALRGFNAPMIDTPEPALKDIPFVSRQLSCIGFKQCWHHMRTCCDLLKP